MKKGICPKCRGNNIYTNKGSIVNYGERTGISITIWKALISEIYICSDCRYFEEYISDSVDLDKMKEKWNKV